MSNIDEKRAVLAESIKLLSTHDPFLRFLEGVKELRENAVQDMCRLEVVRDTNSLLSLIGEVRCYTDIQALVDEHKPKELDS